MAADTFMPEMHLKQHGFTYNNCGPFTKTKKGLKHLCRLEIQVLFTEISSNQLVFSMIGLMVNLAKRTHSDKVLRGKAFKIASDPK